MKKLRVGVIGFGLRGKTLLENVLVPICEGGKIEITSICELSDQALNWAKDFLKEKNIFPKCFKDYNRLLDSDIEAVVVLCGWRDHVDIACAAMEKGVAVGLEVGGAYSVEDCFRLVRTAEKTKTPFMFLENCCYGKRELMLLNMVRKGAFGVMVHFMGGYCHDLRESLEKSAFSGRYRLNEYLNRNGDTYPSHALGPIMQMLGINRGNRIVSLTSMASGAFGMEEYLKKFEEHPLKGRSFAHGDIITTTLKCSGGQTIVLTLNTTLPSSYSRKLGVYGTKGCYNEDNDSVFINPDTPTFEMERDKLWGNATEYEEEYLHKYWKENKAFGSHGGMDGMVFTAFFDSVINGTEPPIDVYDAAVIMAVTPLSERSVALGGAPVEMPDFTNGNWKKRKPIDPDEL